MGDAATKTRALHPPNDCHILLPGTGPHSVGPTEQLSRFLAVFDWIRLGLFTGSHGAEYCQTMARRHEVSWVPTDGITGSHAGKPIAFIMTDFWFLTKDETLLSPLDSLAQPSQVIELQICFWFDKSPINSRWWKFRHTGHGYLCPVLASLSIVQWAVALQVPHSDPLGVYAWTRDDKSFHTYTFLQSTELIAIMWGLVIMAHPDSSHYLRQPDCLRCIDCHSNRITACVALSEANASMDQIAHKLCWSIQSIKYYMHNCSCMVGASTAKVIQGFLISKN